MSADMFRHASHLLHLQVKSIGHRVTEAIVHYLGSHIFVFILFYNLYLVHYTFCLKCIFWSVKATCGQNVNCMHVTILPFVDNGCLGSDDHAQDLFFFKTTSAPPCLCLYSSDGGRRFGEQTFSRSPGELEPRRGEMHEENSAF